MTSIPSSHPSLSRSPSGPSKQDDYVSTLDLTVVLELRVNSSSVRIYPAPPPTISSDMLAATAVTTDTTSQSTHSVCLLSGPLGRFLPFFGREASKWLIDIAHDIYDPAHFRGSLLVWKETLQQWRPVANTDPLTASRYRYDLPDGIVVGLSKISRRMAKSKSVTTDASAMAERVKRRDGECWVTRTNDPLANSHICPTRLGDHVGRIIFHTFTSRAPPHDLSVCDEIFGLSLSKNLNAWFDKYQLGFRLVPESANTYECHMFPPDPEPAQSEFCYTIYGSIPRPTVLPVVHGHLANPPHPDACNNPPSGLFRWHYLQCVFKKFAHDDYKTLADIYFSELPLRMEG